MTETERIVRIFHESWDLRDPERGAAVIAEDCHFEGRDYYDSTSIAKQLGLVGE